MIVRVADKKLQDKKLIVSAFLFDMDGTLVDSNATVEKAWAMWAQRYNLNLPELLAYSHGRPTLATMQYFGERIAPGKDWQAEADELQQFELTIGGQSAEIPGAGTLLAQLIDAPWAVVTSAPRAIAEARIQDAGLPLPRVLVPADEIRKGKPHPEGYLKAARELSVPAERCVVFEDTPPGVEAGLNAGMQVIGLLTTVTADRLRTPNVIRNFFDLRVTQRDGSFEIDFTA
jgi:sugar-phosphatase